MSQATLNFAITTIEIESQADDNELVTGEFSRCGNYLAAIRRDQPVIAYDLLEGKRIALTSLAPARCIAFHPHIPELSVATTGETCGIERFDLRCPNFKAAPFERLEANCLTYSDQGDYLFAGDDQGFLDIFDLECRTVPRLLLSRRIAKEALAAVSISGGVFLGATTSGAILRYDLSDPRHRELAVLRNGPSCQLDCYAFASHPLLGEGLCVLAGSSSCAIAFERTSGRSRKLKTDQNYVNQIRFLPPLRQLVLVGDRGLEVWSTISWQQIYRWDLPHGKIACAAWRDRELFVAWG